MKERLITVLCVAGLMLPCFAQARKAGGGDIVFTPREPGIKPVLFSHDNHVTGQGIKCARCHYSIFQMAKGSCALDMGKIARGYFCGECHDGEKAFGVKDPRYCVRCHH